MRSISVASSMLIRFLPVIHRHKVDRPIFSSMPCFTRRRLSSSASHCCDLEFATSHLCTEAPAGVIASGFAMLLLCSESPRGCQPVAGDARAAKVKHRAVTRTDWSGSSLGERIAHACKLRGWSLNKLGEVAGIASGPVSRLSRRQETTAGSPETLIKLADAAGVNAEWMIYGRGPIERHQGRDVVPLRLRPEWPSVLADAKRRQGGIPEEFWQLAGDAALYVPLFDWLFLSALARELYSAHLRAFESTAPSAPPVQAPMFPAAPPGEDREPPSESGEARIVVKKTHRGRR